MVPKSVVQISKEMKSRDKTVVVDNVAAANQGDRCVGEAKRIIQHAAKQ